MFSVFEFYRIDKKNKTISIFFIFGIDPRGEIHFSFVKKKYIYVSRSAQKLKMNINFFTDSEIKLMVTNIIIFVLFV